MAASARGAQAEGGFVIGYLPTNDPATANPHLDVAVPTNLGVMRNLLLVLSADAVVAIDGGLGTLSEIAVALQHRKPVFGLGTWEIDPARSGGARVIPCETPEEAVRKALEACK